MFAVCNVSFFLLVLFFFSSRKEKKKRTIALVNMCMICNLCIMLFFQFFLLAFLFKKYLAKSAN